MNRKRRIGRPPMRSENDFEQHMRTDERKGSTSNTVVRNNNKDWKLIMLTMGIMEIYKDVQIANTCAAVGLNGFLIYLIIFHSNNSLGKYKYLIMAFAGFEATYAVVVCVGMPINFIGEGSWMVFTNSGILGGTPFAILGPVLYCVFYETWMGFVVFHFLYRYIVVCQPNLAAKISHRFKSKLLVALGCLVFLVYTMICGFFFCTRLHATPNIINMIGERFGTENLDNLGYVLLRRRNPDDGSISVPGTTTLVGHFLFAFFSSSIIFFCALKIWLEIPKMKQEMYYNNYVKLQRQIFVTLLTQTLVPMFFCHIPTFFYLLFPFLGTDVSFGSWSLWFSVLSSVIKWVDPIIVIVGIKQYRYAAVRCLTGRIFYLGSSVNSDENQNPAAPSFTAGTSQRLDTET